MDPEHSDCKHFQAKGGPKRTCHKIYVYCIRNGCIYYTMSTKKTEIQKVVMGLKTAKIWQFVCLEDIGLFFSNFCFPFSWLILFDLYGHSEYNKHIFLKTILPPLPLAWRCLRSLSTEFPTTFVLLSFSPFSSYAIIKKSEGCW